MQKNRAQGIILHRNSSIGTHSLVDRVSEFHTEIISRRLTASGLSPKSQLIVIDRIAENLKAKDTNGVIQ